MNVTRIDRSRKFVPAGRDQAIAPLRWLFPAVCWIVLSACPAWAGSIFMKNGYIIQGPIVEYSMGSEGAVVLGWPNGKVTIYGRFVDRVDFDPGEEKNLKALKESASEESEEILVTQELEDELPQTLKELVKVYNLSPTLLEGPPVPASIPAGEEPGDLKEPGGPEEPPGELGVGVEIVTPPPDEPGEPTGEFPPEVAEVPPPQDMNLGERTSNPKWGFSIQPPSGWKLSEIEDCLSWTGLPGPDGFTPSMNVTSIPRGSLNWEAACLALREDQEISLNDYQLMDEEHSRIGEHSAFCVTGQGKVRGGAWQVKIRQIIVETGNQVWLLSTFVNDETPQQLAELMDLAIQSFHLDG